MGDARNDRKEDSNEKPVHTVNLTYDFWIGKYAVTFNEYDAYCEARGKRKLADNGRGRGTRPVGGVSWYDAIRYCNWLSEREGLAQAYDSRGNLLDKSGKVTTDITHVEGYRLPTEAEWEYAARGGQNSRGYIYAGSDDLNEVGWYDGNSDGKAHPVGEKKPNELGLYDMSGNVDEWCHDRYGVYSSAAQTNPTGPSSGTYRVQRGGYFYKAELSCRPVYRESSYAGQPGAGFRLARTVFYLLTF